MNILRLFVTSTLIISPIIKAQKNDEITNNSNLGDYRREIIEEPYIPFTGIDEDMSFWSRDLASSIIPPPPTKYSLKVRKGDGDGDFTAGTVVSIRADEPSSSNENFSGWEILKGNPIVADLTSPQTELTMPEKNAIVRATFTKVALYTLEVLNGDGDGDYPQGTIVSIIADEPSSSNENFSGWEILKGNPIVADLTSPQTELTMPEKNAVVRATFTEVALFTLEVLNGDGDGDYPQGTIVTIFAEETAIQDEIFSKWEILEGNVEIADVTAHTTTLTMPSSNAKVEAIFAPALYALLVDNGFGNGFYEAGTTVIIVAKDCPTGEEFSEWRVRRGSVRMNESTPTDDGNEDDIIADKTSRRTILTMPAERTRVEALCEKMEYVLEVVNGEGDGGYSEGDLVLIEALEESGKSFVEWVVVKGKPELNDSSNPKTRLTMPAEDVVVEAKFDSIYKLTVVDGTGDGLYPANQRVVITANESPQSEEFSGWIVVSDGTSPDIKNDKSPTVLTMPADDVTIRAVFNKKAYSLRVNNGSGDGIYIPGDEVEISADRCPNSRTEEFDEWVILEGKPLIDSTRSPLTTLIMREGDAVIKAECQTIPTPRPTLRPTPSPTLRPTPSPTLRPTPSPTSRPTPSPTSRPTPSPTSRPTPRPTLRRTPSPTTSPTPNPTSSPVYQLTVRNGGGGGDYPAAAKIPIRADDPPPNQEFKKWVVISPDARSKDIIKEPESPRTSMIMPDQDTIIEATYTTPAYELTIVNGSPSDSVTIPAGTEQVISAEYPIPNRQFVRWDVTKGQSTPESIIDRPNRPFATLTMPTEDLTVEAIFYNQCDTTDNERSRDMMTLFITASGLEPFTEPSSPQSRAAMWMIEKDEYFTCPGTEDKKILQRYVMAVFYYSTGGDSWNKCYEDDEVCGTTNDDFEGQKSYLSPANECEWAGSTCDDEGTFCIVSIIFEEENNVQGTLPKELGALDSLEVISLEAQVLSSTIPREIAKPENMRIIDFDYNRLTGTIPEEIYFLKKLEQLDLNNNLLTGTISNSVGNLESLIFMQLQFNQMTGTFPEALLETPILVAEFQKNKFYGPMPLCIGAPGQSIGALSTDCGTASGAPVVCGENCGCECF